MRYNKNMDCEEISTIHILVNRSEKFIQTDKQLLHRMHDLVQKQQMGTAVC